MGRPPSSIAPEPLRLHLIAVAAAALALRGLAWFLLSRTPFWSTPVVDASQFDIWARALADGGQFMPGAFFKPPLYPYLLAFLYRLGLGLPGVYALQGLVGTGSALLVVMIGRRLLSARAALAAGLITALLPILPFFEFQLLAESWTTALTLLAVWRLLAAGDGSGPLRAVPLATAGAALGVAALGRPNLLLVVAACAGWLVLVQRGRPGGWMRPVGAFVVAAGLLIMPATVHNARSAGAFVPISTNLGANLITGNSDTADGISAIPVGLRWDDLQLRCRLAGHGDNVAASRYLSREALAWIAGHPGRAARLVGRRILALVSGWEPRNNIAASWLEREHGVFVLGRWWPGTWLLLSFALAGLAAVGWDRRWTLVGLVGGAQVVSILPFFVNARFRLPLLPLLALFAAAGGLALARAMRGEGRRRRLVPAVFLVSIVLVNVDWLSLDDPRWNAEDAFNEAVIALRGYGGRPTDPRGAVGLLQRSVELDPEFVDAHERWGSLMLQQAERGMAAIQGSLAQGDRDLLRRQARAVLSALETAEFRHRRAHDLFPRAVNPPSNLGAVALFRAELNLTLAGAASEDGDEVAASRFRGGALQDYRTAIGWLDVSLRLDPGLRTSLENRAYAVAQLQALE